MRCCASRVSIQTHSLDGGNDDLSYPSVSASSPPLVRNCKAGEYCLNRDRLTADAVRRMKMRGGATATDAHIDGLLRDLPDSLDAEFTPKRFDSHRRQRCTLLAPALRSLSMSCVPKETGIATGRDAAVTISRRSGCRLFSLAPWVRRASAPVPPVRTFA